MEKKKRNIKILFITPVPLKGAGCRFRIAQYLPHFKKNGIEGTISPFYSDSFFDIVYKPGRYAEKVLHFLASLVRRIFDLLRIPFYDIIFIYREACPLGPPIFEWIFSRLKPVIYDFDDAIYLSNTSEVNKFIKFFKYPAKISKIAKAADHIIVCNDFLKDYAIKFNKNVSVIPTSVDTNVFIDIPKKDTQAGPIIGWIGSHTTATYLPMLEGVFKKLAENHEFSLKIVGAGRDIKIEGVRVINQTWSLEREISDYQGLDIGVYPLEGSEWDLGKTGFKTVVYMSVGVPPVVSKVGSNKEIVRDGVNGYLAATDDEWFDKISKLVKNPNLRNKIGMAARETVIEKYSVKANTPKYISVFNEVMRREHAAF